MEVIERTAWYLRRVAALQLLPEDSLGELLAASAVRYFKPRECIYLAGDPATDVFFLHGGRVHTQRVGETHTLNTGWYRPVAFFGDEALWGGEVREDQAVAVKAVIAVSVPANCLRSALGQHPEARAALSQQAVARRDALIRRLHEITTCSVPARLASALLDLVSEGTERPEGIELRVTHEHLAELIGSRRETVSLDLAQLEKRGLVRRQSRRILLLNTQGLAQFAADPCQRRRKPRAA